MSTPPRTILLAEDNANDVELVLAAFESAGLPNEIVVARDGEVALDYLHRRGAHASRPPGAPALVVLDLKMPKVDGREVLRSMRADPALRTIPVVVLTSSREESDLVQAYALGINAYVVKPVEFQEFIDSVGQLGQFWSLINEPPPAPRPD